MKRLAFLPLLALAACANPPPKVAEGPPAQAPSLEREAARIPGIGEDIRLSPILLTKETSIHNLLNYYMGKNTPERQKNIIENLRVEKDLVEEVTA